MQQITYFLTISKNINKYASRELLEEESAAKLKELSKKLSILRQGCG